MKGKILTSFLLSVVLALTLVSASSFNVPSLIPFIEPETSKQITINPTNTSNLIDVAIEGTAIQIDNSTSIQVSASPNTFTNWNTTNTTTISLSSMDYSKLKLGKVYSGRIIIKNSDNSSDNEPITINLLRSYCKYGENGTNLSITDVKIDNKGSFISDDGDEDTWYPLDEIKIDTTVQNNNVEEDDKINTLTKIGLYDSKGKEVLKLEEIAYGKIEGSDDVKKTITFNVPADLDEGDYMLYVKAYEKGNEDEICTSEFESSYYRKIRIEKYTDEEDRIVIDELNIEPSTPSCNQEAVLKGKIINVGDTDEEKVKIKLYNSKLGLNLFQIIDDLEVGAGQEFEFNFKIPANTSGNYRMELYNRFDYDEDEDPELDSSYNDESNIYYYSFNIKCEKESAKNAAITASLESAEVKAGQEVTIKTTIKNTGQERTTYIISLGGNEAFSTTQSITPSSLTLDAGQSQDVLITLKLNDNASGEYTFDIKALFDTQQVSQPVSLSVEAKSSFFSKITGSAIGESIKENWFIWAIVLVNIILIIAIIIVAVRISRA